MIDLIIWSKDRAAQLHLLVESIIKYMPDIFNINVIYTYSNEEYNEGYKRFHFDELPDEATLIEESDFRMGTLMMLFDGLFPSRNNFVAFSTDDTILTRPVEFKPEYMEGLDVFSLRLGFNTIQQDIHIGSTQPPLNLYDDEGETISWDFNHYHPHNNYGYPFGLDMHIYNKKKMCDLIKNMPFKNTNELESGLFHKRYEILPRIRSFKQSVAVNVPVNSISGVTRAGEINESPTEYLNEEYLKGRTLSLDKVSNEEIVGCHQEINLEWNDG